MGLLLKLRNFETYFLFLCDGQLFEEIAKLQKFNKTRRQKFGGNGTIALTESKVVVFQKTNHILLKRDRKYVDESLFRMAWT